jgi:hypothetical protein
MSSNPKVNDVHAGIGQGISSKVSNAGFTRLVEGLVAHPVMVKRAPCLSARNFCCLRFGFRLRPTRTFPLGPSILVLLELALRLRLPPARAVHAPFGALPLPLTPGALSRLAPVAASQSGRSRWSSRSWARLGDEFFMHAQFVKLGQARWILFVPLLVGSLGRPIVLSPSLFRENESNIR